MSPFNCPDFLDFYEMFLSFNDIKHGKRPADISSFSSEIFSTTMRRAFWGSFFRNFSAFFSMTIVNTLSHSPAR